MPQSKHDMAFAPHGENNPRHSRHHLPARHHTGSDATGSQAVTPRSQQHAEPHSITLERLHLETARTNLGAAKTNQRTARAKLIGTVLGIVLVSGFSGYQALSRASTDRSITSPTIETGEQAPAVDAADRSAHYQD